MRFAAILASALMLSPACLAGEANTENRGLPTPGKEADQPTSNRSPEKETPTPLPQTTKTDGQTSDRTPVEERKPAGESSGSTNK